MSNEDECLAYVVHLRIEHRKSHGVVQRICGVACLVEWLLQVQIALAVAPFEFAGAALGLLLVLRTNAGYDRWWEACKLQNS